MFVWIHNKFEWQQRTFADEFKSFKFELISEVSSTAISDNQLSARKTRQRDDQRDERKKRIEDILKIMMNVFQVWLNDYRYFLHRFWACKRYVSDLRMISEINKKNMLFALKYICFSTCFSFSRNLRD